MGWTSAESRFSIGIIGQGCVKEEELAENTTVKHGNLSPRMIGKFATPTILKMGNPDLFGQTRFSPSIIIIRTRAFHKYTPGMGSGHQRHRNRNRNRNQRHHNAVAKKKAECDSKKKGDMR